MYVLFTGYYFDGFHGSMLHICEMSDYFNQNGFKCYCASVVIDDSIVKYCKKRNLIVLKANEIPTNIEYEYVFSYHFPILPYLLARGLKYKKIIIGCLSSFHPLEFPLDICSNCTLLTVVSEEAKQNLLNHSIPPIKIFLLKNFIPKQFFEFEFHPSANIRRIAVVSNHPPSEVIELPSFLSNIPVDFWGNGQKHYSAITPKILSQYDVVISIGKTVQYCLGMGIPVFVYDYMGGNGYVRPETLDKEEYFNFSGRSSRRKLEGNFLANDIINNYHQACKDAEILKKIAVERYNLNINMGKLLSIINKSEQCHIDMEKYFFEIEHCAWLLGELLCLYDNKSKIEASLSLTRMEIDNTNKYYLNLKEQYKAKIDTLNIEIDDLKCHISRIENSHFYNFARRYYSIRDKILKNLSFIKYKIIKIYRHIE